MLSTCVDLYPRLPLSPSPATQLFKLMDKYRPETKQAKKERLRERAAARYNYLCNFNPTIRVSSILSDMNFFNC